MTSFCQSEKIIML